MHCKISPKDMTAMFFRYNTAKFKRLEFIQNVTEGKNIPSIYVQNLISFLYFHQLVLSDSCNVSATFPLQNFFFFKLNINCTCELSTCSWNMLWLVQLMA